MQIEFNDLVDGDAFTPALRALPGQSREAVEGWPNSFTCCFSVIYDLFWHIREESGVTEIWPPAPRDVSSVTVTIDTAHAKGLALRIRHLGTWTTVVNPVQSLLEVSIPNLVPPSHWKRCRETAVSYLALGDTREALLFLNIGVESLLEERFRLLADAAGDPGTLAKIFDTRSVWKEAMELVTRDAPEAMEKINWPDREIHQSRATQIKLAHRFFTPQSSVCDVQKHYRSVCQSRNDLVHGTLEKFVPVSEVTRALELFDWLVDNFIPVRKSDDSGTPS